MRQTTCVPEIMTPKCKKYQTYIFYCFFGFNRMVDNSKKLGHEHEIKASACIIGQAYVFASACSSLHDGHDPWHTQYMWLILNYLGRTVTFGCLGERR